MNNPHLETRAQLESMLDHFYARVREDALIGPIFNDVAKVRWDEHIPKIYDFWDSLLFSGTQYRGRPFPPHIPLGLKAEHFRRWLELFFLTVDEHFSGSKAEEVKTRAYNIGRTFWSNLQFLEAQSKAEN